MARGVILFKGIKNLLTLDKMERKDGRYITSEDIKVIRHGCILSVKGKVLWVGPEKNVTSKLLQKFDLKAKDIKTIDLKAHTLMPAFVESHTHLVFAGNRRHEFEMRMQGASYQEIAQSGGGILSTVQKTRQSSLQQLIQSAQLRANEFVKQGVATLEVKSGYGLNRPHEIKMLQCARAITGPKVVTTYLGPHAIPADSSSCEDYFSKVLHDLHDIGDRQLADRVDIFIERGFFSLEQAKRYIDHAKALGFAITIHADQLTRQGGVDLGIRRGATSVDHAIQVNAHDIRKLARSSTTAVLLPAADFYLQMKYPPARKMIDAGVRVALATDFNPGSSPTQEIQFVGLLSRLEMKMTLPEVIAAYTYNAACALGLEKRVGSLVSGKSCDFIVLECDWQDLFYSVGERPVSQTWRLGKRLDS